jgi:inner membrane protein
MNKLFGKLAITTGISIVLSILLFMVHLMVSERSTRREQAASEVANSTAREQVLSGPVLLLTLERTAPSPSPAVVTTEHVYLFPETLEIKGEAETIARRRGIFQVPSYVTKQHLVGTFAPPKDVLSAPALGSYTSVVGAEFVVSVSDLRGLRGAPMVHISGLERSLNSAPNGFARGLYASIPQNVLSLSQALPFDVELEFEGTQSLGYNVPAKNVTVSLRSNWKDPSFLGNALPAEKQITGSGFSAQWLRNAFSNPVPMSGSVADTRQAIASDNADFSVQFVQTVDVYSQSDRATKYGFLFIGLTFAALMLFEVTRNVSVHPVQYGMVGLAMSLFYLLLLSLSEHIPFSASYLAAMIACVALTTFYLRHVLGGVRRGLSFGAMQSGLYAVLFVLLRAEEFALLLGSGLLFAVLAAAMFATRKVDWFALRAQGADAASGPAPLCPLHPLQRPADCVEAPAYR